MNPYLSYLYLQGHDHNVSAVVFSPTGDHIISASRDKTVKIWEVSTGYCIKTLQHEEWVKRVVVSEDGAMVVTASYDQVPRRPFVFDTPHNNERFFGTDHPNLGSGKVRMHWCV